MKNLKVSFPSAGQYLQVVRGVDLKVEQGEIVALLGESGCGKTVTCSAVLGLLQAEEGRVEGEISYRGTNILGFKERDLQAIRGKEISYIFQDPAGALNPYRRIGKQVEEVLKIHGLAVDRDMVLKSLRDVGLDNAETVCQMYPSQLSGGQCQRVMIAMAVLCKPKLVIADEPVTAIDASLQKKILALLKEINQRNNTAIIIVTHDFAVAQYLCQRVVVMYSGLVVEEGAIGEVLNEPCHPYTAELLRCVNSMLSREERLYTLEGRSPAPQETVCGCPFYPRCKYGAPCCRENIPALLEYPGGHKVRCVNFPVSGAGDPAAVEKGIFHHLMKN